MSDSPGTMAKPEIQAVAGYQPSGKIGSLGLPLLLISLGVVPLLAAFVYVRTAHFGGSLLSSVWVLIGTSALLGAVVGAGFIPAIRWGQVRNVPLAVTFGLLAGALAFALALGFEAWSHRDGIQPALQQGSAIQQNSAAQQGNARVERTPLQVAQSYWQERAEGGETVSGRGARDANISGGMFWALLGIQGLLATLVAGVAATLLAQRRYSEQAGRWFVSKTVYNVLPHHVPDLIEAGSAGDWPQFAAIASQSKDPQFKEFKPLVVVHHLPGTPGGTVEIRAVADPKKPITTVFERELTSEQMKFVWSGFPASGSASGLHNAKPQPPN